MSKKGLSESDICDQYITPAIQKAGWDKFTQIRREHGFTDGRVIVRGTVSKRLKRKRVDYLLYYKPNLPIAVIEAKDNNHSISAGMQQGLGYAESLDVPFVFSSNGDGFQFHDRTGHSQPVERQIGMHEFPSPEDLWKLFQQSKNLNEVGSKLTSQPYFEELDGKTPRYYQHIAVQRTLEAIANDQKRLLLLMATGTGKTYTVFQLIWRLWKAKRVQHVLYLVDRNNLVDQTITNDFKPFGSAMCKVKDRKIDPSYEIHLALYQAITGEEEVSNIYKNVSPDFFDLIIIDECHRGSASEESNWREVLDYFQPAIQLGLTATPKETKEVSTLDYFGKEIYEYSLKQGIADGFLAPYKVVKIDIDRDLQGWRPRPGMIDDNGHVIDDRVFNQSDINRNIVLTERDLLVAKKIVDYLHDIGDPFAKTIVFCEDINHAQRMRTALINEVAVQMPEQHNLSKFVVQITGDQKDAKENLEKFIDKNKRFPVLTTTSKLMSTGVDAKTCRLVVLDQTINSMIEFKQIVGRGTRIDDEAKKHWFTVMDFKKATDKFADPNFDGPPVVIYEPEKDDSPSPPEDFDVTEEDYPDFEDNPDDFQPDTEDDTEDNVKFVVSGVPVKILDERVQFLDEHGDLVSESLTDFTKQTVTKQYATLDLWLKTWDQADRKTEIIEELSKQGVFFEELRKKVNKNLDAFDLICHVVYGQPPLTRKERADNVKKRDVYTKYGEQARAVLDALLDKYTNQGLIPIENIAVLRTTPFSDFGTAIELVERFGNKEGYTTALKEIEAALYDEAS